MTVLITDGAKGIGYELACCFSKSASQIVLVDNDENALNAAASILSKKISVVTIKKDLSQPQSVDEVVTELESQSLVIDVLVNNAGFGVYGNLWETDYSAHGSLLRLNVMTPTLLSARLLPSMVASNKGGILNIASMAAFGASGKASTYYASKSLPPFFF